MEEDERGWDSEATIASSGDSASAGSISIRGDGNEDGGEHIEVRAFVVFSSMTMILPCAIQ